MLYLSNYNLIYFLWFLRLFKPEWLVSYFIPGTAFLRALPTLLTYLVFGKFILSRGRKTIDIPYLMFFISIFLSTLFSWNIGLAQQGLRGALDSLIFYSISISILRTDEDFDRLFKLYLLSFIFYGLCGIIFGGKVPFHLLLSDEDAFGPFMDIGIPLSFFMAFRNKHVNYLPVISGLVCVTGLVASFARGAFVAFCTALLFIWYKYPQKIKITLIITFSIAIVLTSSSLFFPENKFWDEMQTIITGNTSSETGRTFLWFKAYDIFKRHPLLGVGPNNFGWVLPRVTTNSEAASRGVLVEHLYNRVTHNIYFQILSELGMVGVLCFMILIIVFLKRSFRVQNIFRYHNFSARKHHQLLDKVIEKNYYFATAVQGSMLAYLVSGLFYDLLFYHWFVDLLILNSLLYYNSLARKSLINKEGF